MATLRDSGKRGLPQPPAPPRRSANPWRLSQTARVPEPEPPQPSLRPQLLAELMKNAAAKDVAPQAAAPQTAPPPRVAAKRSGPGLIGLVIVIIAVTIAVRVFFDARNDGDWIRFAGPLIFIAIAVHGWWRARRRRDATLDGSGTSREQQP